MTLIVFCGCHRIDHVARQASALDGRSDLAASGGEGAEASVSDDDSMDNDSSKDVGENEAESDSSSGQENVETNETGESVKGGLSSPVSTDSVSDSGKREKDAAATQHGSVKTASAVAALNEQSNNENSVANDATYATSSASKLPARHSMITGDAFLGLRLDASTGAPKIGDIRKNGPADRAGLQVGDVLVAFEGVLITDTAALAKVVNARNVGDKLEVVVARNGEYEKIPVTLGSRSNPSGE